MAYRTHHLQQRTSGESIEHRQLIRIMADYFHRQGYTQIRADLEDYEQPEPIRDWSGNMYIPDLTCLKGGQRPTRIVLEAETCSTIDDDHTSGQWRTFARATGEFHLVVPKLCGNESGRAKAQARLRLLGITADEIWTPS